MSDMSLVSNAFQTFIKEAPEYQKVWMLIEKGAICISKLSDLPNIGNVLEQIMIKGIFLNI